MAFKGLVFFALGAVAGVVFFYATWFLLISPQFKFGLRYGGIVQQHDTKDKYMVVEMQSLFPYPATSAGRVQFTYDEKTSWSAITYYFKGDTVVRRTIEKGLQQRELPIGTLVYILPDLSDEEGQRAQYIFYLKRIML